MAAAAAAVKKPKSRTPPTVKTPPTLTSLHVSLSVSQCVRAGVLLLLIAGFLHGVALGVPVWENDHGDSYSNLWWVCLGVRCASTLEIGMKVWFHAVQILAITCSITLAAAVVSAGVHIFSSRLEKKKRSSALATFVIVLAAAIQSLLAVLIYGFGQVPYPDYLYTLSWGFYLELVSSLLLFVSAGFFRGEARRGAASSRALDKRPILRHSNSFTSETCFSLSTGNPSGFAQRSRSESQVRLRTSSFNNQGFAGDEQPASLKGINEVFSPDSPA